MTLQHPPRHESKQQLIRLPGLRARSSSEARLLTSHSAMQHRPRTKHVDRASIRTSRRILVHDCTTPCDSQLSDWVLNTNRESVNSQMTTVTASYILQNILQKESVQIQYYLNTEIFTSKLILMLRVNRKKLKFAIQND